jgi:hypothetical protein
MDNAFGAAELAALKLAGIVVAAVITWVGAHLQQLIKTRAKNERVQGWLLRLDNAAVNGAKEIEQTFVSNLTEALPADWAKARELAIDSIKVHFGAKGLANIEHDLGLDNPEAVEKLIGSFLEARVHDLKALNSTPAGALTGQQAAAVTPERGV